MENSKVRQPKQRRAVEKKEKILRSAFELICEKGYDNMTVTEIADKAGVAPGTLYSYFADKKSIYLAVYEMYHKQIGLSSHEKLKTIKPPFEIKDLVEHTMDAVVQNHVASRRTHDEMMRLVNMDEDFGQLYRQLMLDDVNAIIQATEAYNFQIKNAHEKLHLTMHILDMYAHECVYHKTESLDYSKIRDTIISLVLYMMME